MLWLWSLIIIAIRLPYSNVAHVYASPVLTTTPDSSLMLRVENSLSRYSRQMLSTPFDSSECPFYFEYLTQQL